MSACVVLLRGLVDVSAFLRVIILCMHVHASACMLVCALVCSARTIFDDIVAKTAPAEIVFEDDATIAFRDINQVAPVQCVKFLFAWLHWCASGWPQSSDWGFNVVRLFSVLVVPKRRISALSRSTTKDTVMLGRLLNSAR
jgi:hypothetical protein